MTVKSLVVAVEIAYFLFLKEEKIWYKMVCYTLCLE